MCTKESSFKSVRVRIEKQQISKVRKTLKLTFEFSIWVKKRQLNFFLENCVLAQLKVIFLWVKPEDAARRFLQVGQSQISKTSLWSTKNIWSNEAIKLKTCKSAIYRLIYEMAHESSWSDKNSWHNNLSKYVRPDGRWPVAGSVSRFPLYTRIETIFANAHSQSV